MMNFAQTQIRMLSERLQRVQHHAAYRVQQKGGHRIAQDYAALAAREYLLDGNSASRSIYLAVNDGIEIAKMVKMVELNIELQKFSSKPSATAPLVIAPNRFLH